MGAVPTELRGHNRAARYQRNGIALVAGLVALVALAFVLWPRAQTSTTTVRGNSENYAVELTTNRVSTTLRITRHDHRPVGLDRVLLDPVMPAMGHSIPQVVATKQNDQFVAKGELFTMGGLWDVSIRLADETVTVQVAVTGGPK